MNILESQVSDLNYLAESPIALPGDVMNGAETTASAPGSAGSGKKRKADENNGDAGNNNGAIHTRAKRNRYISIAWYVISVVLEKADVLC